MKTLFILLVGVLIISMINCIIISIKGNNRFSEPVVRVVLAAIGAMLFYSIHLMSHEMVQALLLKGIFFANLDWLIFFVMQYVYVYTDTDVRTSGIRALKYVFLSLITVDSILLVFNAFFQYSFSLEPVYDSLGDLYCWKLIYKLPFYLHVILCYFMVFYSCYVLLKKTFKVSRVHRRKYLIILLAFSITCLLNILRMVFGWVLDASVFFYAILAMTICYLTFIVFPREIEVGLHYMVANHINSAVICFDLNGVCMYISRFAESLFPNSETGRKEAESYRARWIDEGTDWQTWEDSICMNGAEHIFSVEYNCLRDKQGRMEGSYLKFQDRTDEVAEYEKEKYKATHDVLTGLYNRMTFFEKAEEIIRSKPDVPRYLIATNIKDFKLINDLFGTEFGDKVIKEQAKMLQFADYEDCIKGRISADKFAMLIAKKDYRPELAVKNTERVQNITWEVNYKLHICISIYEVKNSWEKVQAMYDKANMAIESMRDSYDVKLVYYDTSLMEQAFKEKYIVGEFPKALEQRVFEVCMVPQIDRNCEIIMQCIALAWPHSVLGRITEEQFIPVLEKTGYSYMFDLYLWEIAIKQLWNWTLEGKPKATLAVGICPKSFYYVDICDKLCELVEQYHVNPSRLYLEIPETVFRHDIKMHLELLNKLQEKGFKIVINNFGSGFSSLNLLKDLHVDILKLDEEFLRETENETRSSIILSRVISMAAKIGTRIVADGIESKEQMDFLINLGCEGFQGEYCTDIIKKDSEKVDI